MTAEELNAIWRKKLTGLVQISIKIKHKDMKTVEFYPISYEESVFHKFGGWWICLQNKEPIVYEVIKIKKEDLQNWNIISDYV